MATSSIDDTLEWRCDAVRSQRQELRQMMSQQITMDPSQEQRLKKARRTALIAAIVAVSFFLFSILQMLWIQHSGTTH